MALSKKSITYSAAGNATLATAVTAFNVAIDAGIVAALAVQNVNTASILVSAASPVFDGSLWFLTGTISYNAG